jgi:probable F420-dependent oxidoreductase
VRFGLQLPTYGAGADPETIVQTAKRAEELGFESVWVNDHVLVPSTLPRYAEILEAIGTLVWVAAHTERIRLGTSVLILPQREPILAAKQLATLDVLSGGRAIAGIGAGYVSEEFGFLGAPFETRGPRIEEQIAVLRALWGGERSFHGNTFRFDDALFGPLPPQGAGLPIWIGGSAPPAIRRAATLADAWHPAHLDRPTLAEKRGELDELARGRSVGINLKLRVALWGEPPPAPGYQMVGGAADVRDELAGYGSDGLDDFTVVFPNETVGEFREMMETFAEQVMPALSRPS